ncbi:uncharacterized protein MAM_04381 [Metarhizium album ARSEF 1941]|uniref:Uncharacterized protein n=1 Tax=Metarhizium album (strain ARSEF 1941) TaxID=1081103 RepID=A0A0B2WX30_METAS|nr:uncharacterized protein MAM_04381 [Metarhizium album ARSEF 1941]KHN97992.1 hypothetical protein MAM_04381 [Metarhizium album ARSEF 1941]
MGDTSNHELMADTAAAITEWQGISRPIKSATYNNYSLTNSSDLFPSDSLSQREVVSLAPSSPLSEPSARESTQNPQHVKPLNAQYDGTVDPGRNTSPEPNNGLAPALDAAQTFHQSKRKASQFSLRSLTRSLSKRPRLVALRQWAANVYHGSSRRLSKAYHRLKHQRRTHFGEFGAWRGIGQRRQQAADDAKGSPDQPYGVFEYDNGPRVNQEWWKDGVTRYRAPSWMFRGK